MKPLKFFKKCKHERTLCIHGDAAIDSTLRAWRHPSFARVRCADCGKPLYHLDLPEICTDTNEPHYMSKGGKPHDRPKQG